MIEINREASQQTETEPSHFTQVAPNHDRLTRFQPPFHTTAREPKRAHLRVPAFFNTKISREDTERHKKSETGGGIGPPTLRGPSGFRTHTRSRNGGQSG